MEERLSSAYDIVGLVPAAGLGSRLGRLPFSKQLYPVGFHREGAAHGVRLKVVSHYLLERMRLAGVRKAYVLIRAGQWDIANYFGDGCVADMRLAYIPIEASPSAPCSLDHAYPFLGDSVVAFGFPDILFRPADLFARILRHRAATGADVVLALVPAERPSDTDMVDYDERGVVRDIVVRPVQTSLRYTWATAVWTTSFSRFMHEYLARSSGAGSLVVEGREVFVGDVVRAAAKSGLRVECVPCPDGAFLDIGTPDDLVRAIRSIAEFDDTPR